MKAVRQILQMQIWSLRTSKKIGICIAVLFVAGFIWMYWLNPSEKLAARAVLEEARKIRTVREVDFRKESAIAEELKAKASKRAWTYRDLNLEMAASSTLFLAQSCKKLEFKFSKRFDTGPCNNNYELLDSVVRRRVDIDYGFLGF